MVVDPANAVSTPPNLGRILVVLIGN